MRNAPHAAWLRVVECSLRVRAQARRRQTRAVLPALESLESLSLLSGFTPAQIASVYGIGGITFSNPSGGTVAGNGAGQTIAIVDPYNDPTIAQDLATFDRMYGLPAPASLTVLNQAGGAQLPATGNASALLETSLDVEWAHAMAPGASIVLVESSSLRTSDLIAAVNTARALPGVSVVSMSWGGPEYFGETSYDSIFTTPSGHQGVTFVASSGDNGAGATWPAVSPNVIGVGGTSLVLTSAGSVQTAWSGSGGGVSRFEPQPQYQQGVVTQSTVNRVTPDVSFVADPATGVSVYSSAGGWATVGGTSVGAPSFSAIVAIIDQGLALNGIGSLDGPSQALPTIYAYAGTFSAVSPGPTDAGSFAGASGQPTGIGTPNAASLVSAILVHGVVTETTTGSSGTIPLPSGSSGVAAPSGPPYVPPAPTGSPALPPFSPPRRVPQPVYIPNFGWFFGHFKVIKGHKVEVFAPAFRDFGLFHARRFWFL